MKQNIYIITVLMIFLTSKAQSRNLFLNGVDISNARNQKLEGVDVKIDGLGNIFILGSQYEVYHEEASLPLVPKNIESSSQLPIHQNSAKSIKTEDIYKSKTKSNRKALSKKEEQATEP